MFNLLVFDLCTLFCFCLHKDALLPAAAVANAQGFILQVQGSSDIDKKAGAAARNAMLEGKKWNHDALIFEFALKKGRVAITGATGKLDFLNNRLSRHSPLPSETLAYAAHLLMEKAVKCALIPNPYQLRALRMLQLWSNFAGHTHTIDQTVIRQFIQECIEADYESLDHFGIISNDLYQNMQSIQASKNTLSLLHATPAQSRNNYRSQQSRGRNNNNNNNNFNNNNRNSFHKNGKRNFQAASRNNECYVFNDGDQCDGRCGYLHQCTYCHENHPRMFCPLSPKRGQVQTPRFQA